MNLKESLENIHDKFINEIKEILDFVKNIEGTIKKSQKQVIPSGFSKGDFEELGKLYTFLEKATDPTKKEPKSHKIKSDKLGKFVINLFIPIKRKSFIAEMALSYIISFQEAFLKDYLKTVLSSRKSLLKSKKTMSYEEACSHKSIKSLIYYLSQKEVDELGFGSIDDFAEYFNKKFNIDFSEFPKWSSLREATYRRHIIIHNRSKTNYQYCNKTGYKIRGKQLIPSIKYAADAGNQLKDFIGFLHTKMVLKLKL